MPDGTAVDFLPRLRDKAPGAALVIVTGYSDLQGAIEALRQGAADYILKPINPDSLRISLGRIAERRRLALAKERSEAVFRHLVEAAECMIVILRPDRPRDPLLQPVRRAADRLPGRRGPRARASSSCSCPRPTAPRWRIAIARSSRACPSARFESPVLCRDGTTRVMVWNARCLPDYEGAPAVLKVGQDITELKEAQERALQAERLAAIGQMVAGPGPREPQRPAAQPGLPGDARPAGSRTGPRRST